MFPPVFILIPSLLFLIVPSASALHKPPALNHFFKRQDEYIPQPTDCSGPGTTCEETCGTGYIRCGDPNISTWCYNPDIGEPCCEPTSPDAWACVALDYCLVQGYCCPAGSDVSECAFNFSVTLPATYSASYPTAKFTSTPFLSATGSGRPASEVTSARPATATAAIGAANGNDPGGSQLGMFGGLLAFAFNLV